MSRQTSYITHAAIASLLAVAAVVWVEHGPLDLVVAQWLYQGQGQWLIAKSHDGFDRLFYTAPKRLLIVFELYIIVAWVYFYKKHKQGQAVNFNALPKIFRPVASLSARDLGYLALTMLLVPTVVASLKTLTQTPCPVSLAMFGGELPYLTILENMRQDIGGKCFPAAHASSGFALYALCFVAKNQRHFWGLAAGATLLAWLMGGYKMAIGDHFLSHTMVSMLLAWAICAGMGWLFFRKSA